MWVVMGHRQQHAWEVLSRVALADSILPKSLAQGEEPMVRRTYLAQWQHERRERRVGGPRTLLLHLHSCAPNLKRTPPTRAKWHRQESDMDECAAQKTMKNVTDGGCLAHMQHQEVLPCASSTQQPFRSELGTVFG